MAELFSTSVLNQFGLSGLLIAATTFVHAVMIAMAAAVLRGLPGFQRGFARSMQEVLRLMGLSLWLMLAHISSIWMWALLYLKLRLFDTVEAALYFSGASYTTLGFGDVLLPDAWRLLSGAAALNGLLLIGLSVAILVDASAKLRLAD